MKKVNGEIKIERGIPQERVGRGRGGRYPYLKMQIGDSFLIPKMAASSVYNIGREGNRQAISKQLPHRFRSGKWKDGYRCWRVE